MTQVHQTKESTMPAKLKDDIAVVLLALATAFATIALASFSVASSPKFEPLELGVIALVGSCAARYAFCNEPMLSEAQNPADCHEDTAAAAPNPVGAQPDPTATDRVAQAPERIAGQEGAEPTPAKTSGRKARKRFVL